MILIANAGSSSLKISLYQLQPELAPVLTGSIQRLDGEGGHWTIQMSGATGEEIGPETTSGHADAFAKLFAWLDERQCKEEITVVGHRVVHGGSAFTEPTRIDSAVVSALHELIPLDPVHLPQAIACIETVQRLHPELPQIACFDTAFHQTMPRVSRQLPLPRRFEQQGVVRFGFHGLSYEYIVSRLAQLDPNSYQKRTVVAHLGNGASMAAIRGGRSVDTTMGMTSTGGLMMGSRTGDLDPGTLTWMMHALNLTSAELDSIVNQQSGLLGISGVSSDMRDVENAAKTNSQAREALDLYCHIARKHLGSMIAVLGGLDRLVFTGGVGEHSAAMRARICYGFEYAGMQLDDDRNEQHEDVISIDRSQVEVRVMPTNEDEVIARHCLELIELDKSIV